MDAFVRIKEVLEELMIDGRVCVLLRKSLEVVGKLVNLVKLVHLIVLSGMMTRLG
jgi:hypothetical protein